jgi:mannose/cellobiose epimerase-like protein (N-acyl-D-glucosamine 2-epimerase family)
VEKTRYTEYQEIVEEGITVLVQVPDDRSYPTQVTFKAGGKTVFISKDGFARAAKFVLEAFADAGLEIPD